MSGTHPHPRSQACGAERGLLGLALALSLLVPATSEAEAEQTAAHFHHVHLNVVDRSESISFYRQFLGAVEVSYRGRQPALFTERSFLLMEEVPEPAPAGPTTVIQHIGWAGIDGPNEFEWFKSRGVEFQTPIGQLGNNYGWYMYGPDRELVEIWTGGQHHRFDHVHLWANDVVASSRWFEEHLGLSPRIGPEPATRDRESIASIRMSFIQCDNVNIVFFGKPDFDSIWFPGANYTRKEATEQFEPTAGHVIDHLGFSYRDIAPVHERMKEAGVMIVRPIATDEETGITSFFVMAPDGLLVEIVQEKPIPQGVWE